MSEQDRASALNRRDLLKAAVAAPTVALVQLMPTPAAAAPVPAPTAAAYTPRVFNAHQYKTLYVLSDLIIPADASSGSATQAGVPEFIDDWLNLKNDVLKTEVLGGLTWIDLECNRKFSHDFVNCTEAQQKEILDRIAYPKKAAPEDANAAAAFSHIRDLVLSGFYSSKIGIEDLRYQGNKMLPSWDGCPESALAHLDVNYQEWDSQRS